MTITPISFGTNVNNNQKQIKTGGASKAVASAFIPGLGQFCDGRNKEGVKFIGASIALSAAFSSLSNSFSKTLITAVESGAEKLPKSGKNKLIGMAAIGVASSILYIANIVDAFKGNKSKKNIDKQA